MSKRTTRAVLSLIALFAIVTPLAAGDDHDHGAAPAPSQPAAETPRLAIGGAKFDLVAIPDGHTLMLYLDRADSNEPVSGAEIIVARDGQKSFQANEFGPGLYQLDSDWVETPGSYSMTFKIVNGEDSEALKGTLAVPEHHDAVELSVAAFRDVLARADILAALAAAFVFGGLIVIALRRRRPRDTSVPDTPVVTILVVFLAASFIATSALAGPGHDHDHGDGGHDDAPKASASNAPRKQPDGSIFLPKPTQRLLNVRTMAATEADTRRIRTLLGTVISDPSAFGQVQAPMDGQIELSARGISFAGQKVQAGEVLALLTPTIPLADLGTMQQLRAEVDGKLIIAQQKLSRLTRIANVIAQRDIDDTRAELEALQEQKRVLAPKGVEKIELKAPVSGVISVANVRAGQVVSARDTLFEIVDPERLWIEAIGNNLHNDSDVQTAHAVDNDGHSIKLGYAGRSPTLRQQSQPYLFRVDEPHSGLAIGAPVSVLVETQDVAKGLTVPDAAIVRASNGLQQVWIKTAPEIFRAVAIRAEPLDGRQTLVLDGLHAGDRVVISGAELINQIR